jgi:hypothetical protein
VKYPGEAMDDPSCQVKASVAPIRFPPVHTLRGEWYRISVSMKFCSAYDLIEPKVLDGSRDRHLSRASSA